MSLYPYLDWKYTLPCADKIPREIDRTLHPWIKAASRLGPFQSLEMLRARWKKIPPFLRPLRDRILEGKFPAILGYRGWQWLEITIGAQRPGCDWPYLRRSWSTPSRFDPEKARAFLLTLRDRRFTRKSVAEMDVDAVEFHAYREWGGDRRPKGYEANDYHEGEVWSLYVAPPADPEGVAGKLESLGLDAMESVRDFVTHFDHFRESPPRSAGGFYPHAEWRTVEAEAKSQIHSWFPSFPAALRREWGKAVIVFYARNGDAIYLHPNGRVAWMASSEGKIKVRWRSFEDFITHYVDALDYRWPFDSYGPSPKAVEARRKRNRNS